MGKHEKLPLQQTDKGILMEDIMHGQQATPSQGAVAKDERDHGIPAPARHVA